MSSPAEVRMEVPHLPLMVLEKILQYVPSTADRKNFRLVCFNWLYVIDRIIGLGFRLTKKNKAKLFASGLLRSCTSLKIEASAGLLNWYVCFFSPTNLKSVEIIQNILADNWKLLLDACKSMESLTVTANVYCRQYSFYEKRKNGNFPFNFPIVFVENKINHKGLRRLVFKEIQCDMGLADFISTANMMNSLGLVPRLQQVVFALRDSYSLEEDLRIQTSLSSLMDRNPMLKSVGILEKDYSGRYDMSIFDTLLPENKDCLVQHGGFYSRWRQVFDRVTQVDTVHFRVSDLIREFLFDEFQSLCALLLMMSPTLRKLFIVIDRDCLPGLQFDCALILQGLEKLTELSICSFFQEGIHVEYEVTEYIISNLNVLNGKKTALEYFYISVPVTETNLNAIFAIQNLKELHIMYQGSAVSFKKRHFDMLTAHPSLKFIFWEKALQDKYNKFIGTTSGNRDWSSVQLRQLKPQQCLIYGRNITVVDLQHEGYLHAKIHHKKFGDTFVLFNLARLEEHDWDRIEANAKSES